jgi:hypothetical protein
MIVITAFILTVSVLGIAILVTLEPFANTDAADFIFDIYDNVLLKIIIKEYVIS